MSEDFYTIAERSGKDFKMFSGFDDEGQIEWTYGFTRALKLKTKEATDALLEGLPAFEGTSGKVYRVAIEEMAKAETEPEETEKEEEAAQPEESDRVWIHISEDEGAIVGRLMTVLCEICEDDEIRRFVVEERGFISTPLPVLKDMLKERK